jgi:hypothetical protein
MYFQAKASKQRAPSARSDMTFGKRADELEPATPMRRGIGPCSPRFSRSMVGPV